MAICPYGGVVDGGLFLGTLCLEGEALKTAYPVITEKVDRILVHGAAMVG